MRSYPLGARPPQHLAWQMGRTVEEIEIIGDCLNGEIHKFEDEAERLEFKPVYGTEGRVFRQLDTMELWMCCDSSADTRPELRWVKVQIAPVA